jgi:hypothetical protein
MLDVSKSVIVSNQIYTTFGETITVNGKIDQYVLVFDSK